MVTLEASEAVESHPYLSFKVPLLETVCPTVSLIETQFANLWFPHKIKISDMSSQDLISKCLLLLTHNRKISVSNFSLKKQICSAWLGRSAEHPTLDFGAVEFEPHICYRDYF